jgi:hypothetical protein
LCKKTKKSWCDGWCDCCVTAFEIRPVSFMYVPNSV